MTITYHAEMVQGSQEWLDIRCGLLTASEMKLVLTPTLKIADNEKTRAHVYELLAQRVTKYVEPMYIGDDMIRGMEDEIIARQKYADNYDPVVECGFITNDDYGFTIGYSPDALVGNDGLLEIKSRRQKYQFETIIECVGKNEIPSDYILQCQTGLLVSGRKWLDFISYSGGVHMAVIRVLPDATIQDAILNAARKFEDRLKEKMAVYNSVLNSGARLLPTERTIYATDEIVV